MESKPKVSVCVVTFNQRNYIDQCLQSLVNQKTDFDFEIIVCDDCSTDGTSEIVLEYSKNFPGVVKAVVHEENVGAYKNYILAHRMARGNYIAHVDGDDYAMPGKLAKQVQVLDSYPSIALSVHAVAIEGSSQLIGADANLPTIGSMDDLLVLGPYFVNSSIMYRSINRQNFEDAEQIVDYQVYIEHASRGGIYLDKEILGVYRWHAGGMSKSSKHREKIESLYRSAFGRALELGASSQVVKRAQLKRQRSMAIARLVEGDTKGFKHLISIPEGDFQYASAKHRILNAAKNSPFLGFAVLIARKMVK